MRAQIAGSAAAPRGRERLGHRAAVPVGLLLGAVLDTSVADPGRWHPVAGFGRIASLVEPKLYRDERWAGATYVGLLSGSATAVTWRLQRVRSPAARLALTAIVTWGALGGASLHREARTIADHVREGDLTSARERLPWLCGRDPSDLDAAGIARATVESVAENTSDAVVATVVFGAVLGPAGVVLHRTVNTLDAMVGYRTARYHAFGWASARLDDLLNVLPARLTAMLSVALATTVDGRPARAWRAWRAHAGGHPSPNAGPVEASMAGALDVTLGGSLNRYGDQLDRRPAMGGGPPPGPDDIDRSVRLSAAVGLAALVLAASIASVRGCRR